MPLSLEDGTVPGIARNLLNFTSILILAIVIWASFAEVKELAVAEGTLVPSGSEVVVEHLEGGIIDGVLVAEGDVVDEGTPLMRLRAVATDSDLDQLRARANHLGMEKLRIDANLVDAPPDFGKLGAAHPEIAHFQSEIFTNIREVELSRNAVALARIEQKNAEISALESQRTAVAGQSMIQREQLAMREKVLKAGFTSRRDFLEAQSRYRQAEADLAAIEGRLAAARKELAEARNQANEARNEARRKLLDEQARVSQELAEADQGLLKFRDRSERLEIRAPIRGTVKELTAQSVGKVLKPGDIAARMVPVGNKVVAEVRVRPRDISYVKSGLNADVSVTALDPNVDGKLQGRVMRVSPSTFQTDQGDTYYRATIEINPDRQGRNGPQLLPGMIVQANIITGSKSIMRYLLKPVVRSLDQAFGER